MCNSFCAKYLCLSSCPTLFIMRKFFQPGIPIKRAQLGLTTGIQINRRTFKRIKMQFSKLNRFIKTKNKNLRDRENTLNI